ncbi:hypothetical protein M0802_003367 [Mischocyttarus mexicanus]|nr:hypothetical protein M0802_003367 [Mischocyttarus mexicanus]
MRYENVRIEFEKKRKHKTMSETNAWREVKKKENRRRDEVVEDDDDDDEAEAEAEAKAEEREEEEEEDDLGIQFYSNIPQSSSEEGNRNSNEKLRVDLLEDALKRDKGWQKCSSNATFPEKEQQHQQQQQKQQQQQPVFSSGPGLERD